MDFSFFDLNNQGVCRLRDGKHEEAAKLFYDAFYNLKALIMRRNRHRRNKTRKASHVTDVDHHESLLEDIGEKKKQQQQQQQPVSTVGVPTSVTTKKEAHADDEIRDDHQHRSLATPARRRTTRSKRKAVYHEEKSEMEQKHHSNKVRSSKRQRIDTYTRSGATEAQISHRSMLCRPLWLEPVQNKRRDVLVTFASVILYNMAYSFHRMGTDLSSSDRCASFRQQAMSIYIKLFQLCGSRRCPIVKWMCCHNLQQLISMDLTRVVAETSDDNMARKLAQRVRNLETHKVLILRALRFSTTDGFYSSDHLFLSVLSLLGISGEERIDSPAAAA